MIFVDRSIPRDVTRALQMVRDDIIWHDDRFLPRTPDTEWLEYAGRSNWLVVTRDKMLRRRPDEVRAILNFGVGVFLLAQSANPTRWGYLKLLAATLDEMERLFAETPRPFLFAINSTGAMRQIL